MHAFSHPGAYGLLVSHEPGAPELSQQPTSYPASFGIERLEASATTPQQTGNAMSTARRVLASLGRIGKWRLR